MRGQGGERRVRCGGLPRPLFGLDPLPRLLDVRDARGGELLLGAQGAVRVEDMRVAADHLGGDGLGHRVQGEAAVAGGDRRVQHHLEQNVAHLQAEAFVVPVGHRGGIPGCGAGLDHLERLVGLLHQVLGEHRVGEPPGPGAVLPQLRHHPDQAVHLFTHADARSVPATASQSSSGRAARRGTLDSESSPAITSPQDSTISSARASRSSSGRKEASTALSWKSNRSSRS